MKKTPNILLILSDQQRNDTLGCYGGRAVPTPAIDSLAQEGVVFDQCYCTAPICTPSRASLLTGKHVSGHGVYRLHDVLPDHEVMVPKHLQTLGYQTALVGKLHVSARLEEAVRRHPNDGYDRYLWSHDPSLSFDSPFNAYKQWLEDMHEPMADAIIAAVLSGRRIPHIPQPYHMTQFVAEQTVAAIRARDPERPFFINAGFFDPHSPYDDNPAEMMARVDETAFEPPIPVKEDVPEGVKREQARYRNRLDEKAEDRLREARLGYYSSVGFIDDAVGLMVEALKQEGLYENTLIIFASDHGDMMGDHGLYTKGAYFYDASAKVPLIIKPTGQTQGRRVAEPTQLNDLAATMLAAGGWTREQIREGLPEAVDLTPFFAGERPDNARGYAVCVYRNTGYGWGDRKTQYFLPEVHATMYREGRFKLNIFHNEKDGPEDVFGELYDMEADPGEEHNLWAQEAYLGVRLDLTQKMLRWQVWQDYRSRLLAGGENVPW